MTTAIMDYSPEKLVSAVEQCLQAKGLKPERTNEIGAINAARHILESIFASTAPTSDLSADTQISEIFQEAAATGCSVQTYDPNQLVLDVVEVLGQEGYDPIIAGRLGCITGGCGMLLRAFRIVPAAGYQYVSTWREPDSR